MKKMRADQLLMERGQCDTKEEAAKLILAGRVRSHADHVIAKTSDLLPVDSPLWVDGGLEFVSRGAYKLVSALDRFLPDLSDLTALDVGASTGGFTDLMIQRGAKKVYASDVGKGLLHGRLRNDSRVIPVESVNARELSKEHIPEPVDVVTMDLSFISVTKVLPAVSRLMKEHAMAFILVKPQFEAKREDVPPGGVIVDEALRERLVNQVILFAAETLNWTSLGVEPSPIKGPKGNQEFVAVFTNHIRTKKESENENETL